MNCLPAMGLQPSYVMYKGMITAAAEVQGCQTCSVGVAPQPTLVMLCIFKKSRSPEFNLRAAHGILFKHVCIM